MTVIWSGVTSEGAVVPVQVDGAGRVVATTGEPPQPPIIEYNGASAWGNVAEDGTLSSGLNISSVTRTSTGNYAVVFTTPMPDANYAVSGTCNEKSSFSLFTTSNLSPTGFTASVTNNGGSLYDNPFTFSVFSSNALPPVGGTGTDSWGSVDAAGNLLASFNVASVTRTGTGECAVTFTTPMPTANYAVTANQQEFTGVFVSITNKTAEGFDYITANETGQKYDISTSFQVNGTNAVLPVTVTAEQLYAVTNNWYLEEEEDGGILTTRYKVEMQEGIKFAGGKAGITRDGELYFTSNGAKYVIAVNDEQIGLTRIDSAY